MIQEEKIRDLNNNPPKVKKPAIPQSINKFLIPNYFSALFLGAKNSGKSYGIVKLLKNFEEFPIKNLDGEIIEQRIILFCPTAHSSANPIFSTLKNLDENDIHLQYTDELLNEVIEQIKAEKEEIEIYESYTKIYKKFLKYKNTNKLKIEELELLAINNFEELPTPKYKHPRVVFMIFDDLIGDNKAFKRGASALSNLLIKHRHHQINMIFTTQNPKSIPTIIRNNIDLWVLYRFANVDMVIEKCYSEVSSIIDEDSFKELYKYAVNEPHNALVIDTHPKTPNNERFKLNFDVILHPE